MDPDLRDFLTVWTGGELDSARCDEILARVRRDGEFRRSCAAEVRMLGMLKAVQSSEPRWLRLEDELGLSTPVAARDGEMEEAIVSRLPMGPPARRSPSHRWAWRAAAAALVAIVFLPMSGSWRQKALPDQEGRPPALAPAPTPIVATPEVPVWGSPTDLAMVLRLDGVRWEPSPGPAPVEGDVLRPGRLRFRAGRLTLSMFNGVVLIVEGPADMDLVSTDQVFCRRGTLRAQVPKGAEGFVVSAPGSAVVDLGTDFAVALEPDGRARGRVYGGMVEAAVLGPGGTVQRTRVMPESRSFEIDPTSGQIEANEGSEPSVEPSDLVATPLILDEAYPGAILASSPWAYWRFEAIDGSLIANEVADGPPLRVIGPVRIKGPDSGNRYAEFAPGDRGKHLALDGLWEPKGPAYAVELWFLPEQINHAALASLLTPADSKSHSFLLELTSRNRLTLHKPASIRLLHRLPPKPTGGDNTFSDPYYRPYRWHHLVGQINVDRMELFVNGEPTPPLSIEAGLPTPPGQFLLGRLTTGARDDPGTSRPFYGQIDEVALYNHTLSPEEIRRHYLLGRPPAGRKPGE